MSMNLNGGAVGGNLCLTKAGVTGLSGAASTFTIAATGGATGLTYTTGGKFAPLKANAVGIATPVNDAGSAIALNATAASGAAFRPLTTQQAIASSGSTMVQAGSACVFVFGLDFAGNVRVAQGKVVPYNDTSAGSTICPLPVLPDWITPFSYVVVKYVSATAQSWTFGAGLWNVTGITIDTPVDVMDVPAVDPITA